MDGRYSHGDLKMFMRQMLWGGGAGKLRHVIKEAAPTNTNGITIPSLPLGFYNCTKYFPVEGKGSTTLWPSLELASLWVPNLECGRGNFLKQSQLPARLAPESFLGNVFSQQPAGVRNRLPRSPRRSNIGSSGHGRPASGKAAAGTAGAKWCLLHPSDGHL